MVESHAHAKDAKHAKGEGGGLGSLRAWRALREEHVTEGFKGRIPDAAHANKSRFVGAGQRCQLPLANAWR